MNGKTLKFWMWTLIAVCCFLVIVPMAGNKRYGKVTYNPWAKINPEKFIARDVPVLYVYKTVGRKSGVEKYFPVIRVNALEVVEPIAHGLDSIIYSREAQPDFIYEIEYYKLTKANIIINQMTYKGKYADNMFFINEYKDKYSDTVIDKLNKSISSFIMMCYMFLFFAIAYIYYHVYIKKEN